MRKTIQGLLGFTIAISTIGVFGQIIDLPTSKQIVQPVPGNPRQLNSLPMSMAVSPDRRYIVTINAGFGTFESNYQQSLAVMDTETGKVTDFPEDRASLLLRQTLYSGLAFSQDGKHIYASMGSTTYQAGDGAMKIGNAILVYEFQDGKIIREPRVIPIPLQTLAAGRKTKLLDGIEGNIAFPFPAAIAVVKGLLSLIHI